MGRPFWTALLALGSAALAGAAQAASTHHFDIPAEPVNEALIDFAIQANISVGGSAHCVGRSQPLTGDVSIEAGLTRLLAGASCRFLVVAPDTVRIVEVNPAPPRVALALGPRPIRGESPSVPDARPIALPEVIVTATRRPAIAAKLADSISVVSAETIRNAGATDASDIASQLAGITTTNLGPGRDKILLRGLSDGAFTGRTESTVGIYLDDTPITFNAPDPDLRLTDVQSVEVLRGPQGFLFGGGSISGVYRIVTRKPQFNQQSESVLVGGALTRAGAPSGEAEAVLNLPLIKDKAALRAVIYGEEDGGYINNVTLRQSNVDSTTRVGGRLALRLLTNSDWMLTLGGAYQQIITNDTQYVTPGLGRLHIANQIDEASHNHFGEVNLAVEHAGPWGDFKSITSVIGHNFFTQTDASTALPLFNTGAVGPRVGAYDENTDTARVIEDLTLASPNSGRLQWLAGAAASTSVERSAPDVRAQSGPAPGSPGQVLYVEHRRDRFSGMALFGQGSYALTPRLSLEAGVRLAWATVYTDSLVEAVQSGRRRSFTDRVWSGGVYPKLAVKYQASEDLLIYALASEGHRPGGFNTGAPIGTVFNGIGGSPPRRFAADQLWNLEAGLKANLLDDRLKLRSALFYDVWNDIQTDQFLASGLSYTANAGNGRNFGSETELTFQVTDRLKLRASALINGPQLLKANPGFSAVGHVGLPGVPDFSAGAQAEYAWPIGWGLFAALAAQSQYVGRSHLTFNPDTSPRMGGYELNRLSAQLRGENWRLSAFVINPTNASGNTFSYGNPFNFRQIAEVTPQRPLTFRMTLGIDY